jgi:hypothetical protein
MSTISSLTNKEIHPHLLCLSPFHLKMNFFNLKNYSLIILNIVLFLWTSRFETCHAREGHQWSLKGKFPPAHSVINVEKEKGHGSTAGSSHQRHGRSTMSKFAGNNYMLADDTMSTQQEGSSKAFNVLEFGAKGDGKTDDSEVICFFKLSFSFSFAYVEKFCWPRLTAEVAGGFIKGSACYFSEWHFIQFPVRNHCLASRDC